MKKYIATVALLAGLAQPAGAITFPSLTTIYVGSGVTDSGGASGVGVATSFLCSNVSGQEASIRFLVLKFAGGVEASITAVFLNGGSGVASTHETNVFTAELPLNTGAVQGVVNIEATNSAIFCTATVIDASGATPAFAMDIKLVRVNPHPGTVE